MQFDIIANPLLALGLTLPRIIGAFLMLPLLTAQTVPAMVRIMASVLWPVISLTFSSAILRSWAWVTLPTLFLFGSPEPCLTPAASARSTAAGGLLISKSNERSL